jgi:hypothetical protein
VGDGPDKRFYRGAGSGARWLAILAVLLCAAAATPASASAGTGGAAGPLDLGAPGLPESRTVQSIQRGVTLTRIRRAPRTPPRHGLSR